MSDDDDCEVVLTLTGSAKQAIRLHENVAQFRRDNPCVEAAEQALFGAETATAVFAAWCDKEGQWYTVGYGTDEQKLYASGMLQSEAIYGGEDDDDDC